MLRYISLVWNISDIKTSDTAQRLKHRLSIDRGWKVVQDLPGLTVAVIPDPDEIEVPVHFAARNGCALGIVFRKSTNVDEENRLRECFDQDESQNIISTCGRSVIASHWGSYVLFFKNDSKFLIGALRGPVSRMPCFHKTHMGLELIFSTVEDIVEVFAIRPSINWRSIRAQSAYGNFLSHQTALQDIHTVECGECITLERCQVKRSTYWTPGVVASSDLLDNFDSTAEALRERTQRTTHAWASAYGSIIHQLSGGVDSSIVLASLVRSPSKPNITCINQYVHKGPGDEREYARAVARHCGVELIERLRAPQVDLRVILSSARTAHPVLNFSAFESDEFLATLAERKSATAIFDGELGDEIFGHWPGRECLTEYIRRYGFGLGMLTAATDYAVLRRQSIWRALLPAIRDAIDTPSKYWDIASKMKEVLGDDLLDRNLIAYDAVQAYQSDALQLLHPWLCDVQNVPLGRMRMIYALMLITSPIYQRPFWNHRNPAVVSPLASQPLVELVLTTASHLHFFRGRDRALARHSFADALPTRILERRGKGTHELWIREVVAQNRPFLRDVLLGGVLVRERIICKEKVEAALSDGVSGSTIPATDVIQKLYIEAWLRRWDHTANPTVVEHTA
jgi:asparagine synthase (glutamine-hydrolysing)